MEPSNAFEDEIDEDNLCEFGKHIAELAEKKRQWNNKVVEEESKIKEKTS